MCNIYFQISMSVIRAITIATRMPCVTTLTAHLRARARMDSQETGRLVVNIPAKNPYEKLWIIDGDETGGSSSWYRTPMTLKTQIAPLTPSPIRLTFLQNRPLDVKCHAPSCSFPVFRVLLHNIMTYCTVQQRAETGNEQKIKNPLLAIHLS